MSLLIDWYIGYCREEGSKFIFRVKHSERNFLELFDSVKALGSFET